MKRIILLSLLVGSVYALADETKSGMWFSDVKEAEALYTALNIPEKVESSGSHTSATKQLVAGHLSLKCEKYIYNGGSASYSCNLDLKR